MPDSDDKITYAEPPRVFSDRPSIGKYIRYLKFFGPGAIVASLTLGQGQLILGPQLGALAGYSLLWLITINIGSYLIAYISCRFMMISGIEVIDLFALKSKKGWFNWLLIAIMVIFIPIFAASIITTLGQSLQWMFGFGHYLIWGISFSIGAAILVIIGRYRLLEYTQALFVAVLAIGAVVSVLFLQPNFFEILPNFFTIGQNVPETYPSWINQIADFNPTPIPLLMLGYLGTLTFTLITLVGYLGWIKEKKWGFEIGAHSLDHPQMGQMESGEVVRQVLASAMDLQERFRIPIRGFAFPFSSAGIPGPVIRTIIQQGITLFGISGIRETGEPQFIQRIDMEKFRLPARDTLGIKFLHYTIRKMGGRHRMDY